MWKYIVYTIIGGIGLFLLIQLIPYGRNHNNPPVAHEPSWPNQETRQLAVRACYDCHSNETVWPWYSNIAPISWLVTHDVNDGRERLNFSEWNQRKPRENEMVETVQRGGMPPFYYIIIHPSASLTPNEKDQLVNGLQAIWSP
jgi:mannose/cellobiose epimerase-like protein (N-acyl-D-glucosamine 2-epimerase family)